MKPKRCMIMGITACLIIGSMIFINAIGWIVRNRETVMKKLWRLHLVKASIILGIRNYFIVNAIFFSSSPSHPTVKVHIPVWYPLRMIAVAVPW